MFAKETYVQRRAQLKKTIGSGVLLFLGNDEQGLNYEDNTFRYRQDSTFLYLRSQVHVFAFDQLRLWQSLVSRHLILPLIVYFVKDRKSVV